MGVLLSFMLQCIKNGTLVNYSFHRYPAASAGSRGSHHAALQKKVIPQFARQRILRG